MYISSYEKYILFPVSNLDSSAKFVELAQVKMAATINLFTGLVCLSVLLAVVFANKKTLVLVDNWSMRETHSIYFRALRGKMFFTAPDRCNVFSRFNKRSVSGSGTRLLDYEARDPVPDSEPRL